MLTVLFVTIQVILKLYAVSSLCAMMLSYAAVKLAAARRPAVHSSSCRAATSIAVFFGSALAGSFACGVVGMLLVLLVPRAFLWWPPQLECTDEDADVPEASGKEPGSGNQDVPVQGSDEDVSFFEISDTEPAGLGRNALPQHFSTQFKLEESGAQKSGRACTSYAHACPTVALSRNGWLMRGCGARPT